MARKIPKEHEDVMIEAYLNGATQEEAAALFGYSGPSCGLVLKRYGIPLRTASEVHRIPREHEDAMIEAYLNGATQEEAVSPFGHDVDTFLRVLRRRGIPPRSSAESQRIPTEHEEGMIAAYLAGYSSKKAGALFGYSGRTCLNVLLRHNIKPRNSSEAGRKITIEQEEQMIAVYLEGASAEKAASLFGFTKQVCYYALRRQGLSTRSFSEIRRHYAVDESFFDCIDTEDKAYWLGFLTADGSVSENSIYLVLKQGDINHLKKFLAVLQSEHPIKFRENFRFGERLQAYIQISSIKLTESLAKLGVVPNKTFIVSPYEQMPDALKAAYWRGIFDGDGCICRFGPSKSRWYMALCGNYAIVDGFRKFVSPILQAEVKISQQNKIFEVRYAGYPRSYKVAKLLYGDASIYLDRKYDLAKQLCGESL